MSDITKNINNQTNVRFILLYHGQLRNSKYLSEDIALTKNLMTLHYLAIVVSTSQPNVTLPFLVEGPATPNCTQLGR